ncbi:HDOD domain-containing protein [Aquincola tertiaricarbonis]|uniref:HDOD domain-containing protein n=1 Tax=Aquincola tertiaricarbonis TaxID=391953 RepID=A0ABY4SD49_AQUTE|nr:HDOD domain-containing protein [Aquincola tertiaricarbonis]URI10903.1 HDOD domain-containing protein [Aquincola tertiaricarbonis]
MRNWLAVMLSGLTGRRTHPRGAAALVAPAAAEPAARPTVTPFPAPALPADLSAPFVEWLQDSAPSRETPIGPRELRALRHLDTLLADPQTPADLLPRTPAVVPQLLNLLRQDDLPLAAVTERITKDVQLTAEVLRLANTAHYRQRASHAVSDLSQAVAALGADGVQRAIARVVLKPLYEGQGGRLSARAAPRLWEHGERKAVLCAALAGQRGLEPFEGYLAGLMHNAGWSIAWRAFDRMDGGVSTPFSQAFVQQLVLRKDKLFGRAAAGWQISASLTALGEDILAQGLEPARSPLAAALALADREATIAVLAPIMTVALPEAPLLQPAA